jgi:mannan polymerase II complex MNN10 subunit
MLIRSLRGVPPSLVLLLFFLAFLGWQLSQGPKHEEQPPLLPPPPPPPAPVEEKPNAPAEVKPPRIAVMTFVTDQRSYLHLSLKNHDRRHVRNSLIVIV